MPRVLLALALIVSGFNVFLQSEEPGKAATGHYLFAWTGDLAKKGTTLSPSSMLTPPRHLMDSC